MSCTCARKSFPSLFRTKRQSASFAGKRCRPNHDMCTSRVGPHSWCRTNNTCKDGPHIVCGCKSRMVGNKKLLKLEPVEKSSNRHAVCTAIDPASWCTRRLKCQGYPEISCGCNRNRSKEHSTKVPLTTRPKWIEYYMPKKERESLPAVPPKPDSPALPVESTSKEFESVIDPDSSSSPTPPPEEKIDPVEEMEEDIKNRGFVLWAEWPSLDEGAWPEYFRRLLSFVRSNCGKLRVDRIVLRILDPEFQSDRGNLWQISVESSFFKDFLILLPKQVEVHVYPYLMERMSAKRWSDSMQAEAPLEATFKFAREWNDLLEANGVKARIAGVVTDKEERKFFADEIDMLHIYKAKYSSPGHAKLRFGWAIGFDSVGSIDGTSPLVDDFYVEMYDFYINGIVPPVVVEAHSHDPDSFLRILDDKVWTPHIPKYTLYPNIVFVWSLQHRASSDCNFPLPDGTCGERVDFGSWSVSDFNQFLDKLDNKHPVFAQRLHGLFQFNYLPLSWQQQCAAK